MDFGGVGLIEPIIGAPSHDFMRNLLHMGVEPKIGGFYPPKWMVYHEKPY